MASDDKAYGKIHSRLGELDSKIKYRTYYDANEDQQ